MKFLLIAGILLVVWRSEIEAHSCEVSDVKCTFRSVTLSAYEVLINVPSDMAIEEIEFVDSDLHSLPSEIFGLFVNLTKLELSKQKIKKIKENSFNGAKKLKIVDLSRNEIEILKQNSFLGCDNLESLDVGANALEIIEQGAFNGLSQLRELSLRENRLVEIRKNLFDQLENLQIVRLQDNRIESLNEDAFQSNFRLREIHLDGNQINSIHYKTFSKLSNLNRLFLKGNKCVNKNWISDTFQADDIEEILMKCDINYMVDMLFVEFSKKVQNLENKMLQFTEDLTTKINVVSERIDSSLPGLEGKIENVAFELSRSKQTGASLDIKQSIFNETLMEISTELETVGRKFSEAKIEERFSEMDQRIVNMQAIPSTNFENLLTANQNNENLLQTFSELLKDLEENHTTSVENFNATLLGMEEKILDLQTRSSKLESEMDDHTHI